MAGLKCVAKSGAQTTVANTAKTILQITASSNNRVVVTGFSVTVAGTSAVDITLRVLRQTTAGTAGTTSGLITKLTDELTGSILTSASTGFSAEPAAGDVLQYKKLQGAFEKYFPMGQEINMMISGRLGIEVTTVTAATVAAEFYFEE